MRFMQTTFWHEKPHECCMIPYEQTADMKQCRKPADNFTWNKMPQTRKPAGMEQKCRTTADMQNWFHMQACTHNFNKKPVRNELPSEILLHFHFQTSSSQIFFARSISTLWCGVHTLFRESHLSAHFDFRTHGFGFRCHLVHDECMLSFRVIALATVTRRKQTSAASASLLPGWIWIPL